MNCVLYRIVRTAVKLIKINLILQKGTDCVTGNIKKDHVRYIFLLQEKASMSNISPISSTLTMPYNAGKLSDKPIKKVPAAGTRISVSTYSLSRALGATYHDTPSSEGVRTRRETYGAGSVSLLEIPAQLAAAGIHTFEISHPHLPQRETSYLRELRAAIKEAGVHLLSVLIEDGDITHADYATRDLKWIAGWIETAGQLGAERARVIAGKAACTPATLQQSLEGMRELTQCGTDHNVRVTTENWFDLLAAPSAVHFLLDGLEGTVGFNLDFGNWGGPTKYDDIAAIFPYAESCHAKCSFLAPYEPDSNDFCHCLDLARSAAFTGPYTMIYNDAGDDEWRGLVIEREMIASYL